MEGQGLAALVPASLARAAQGQWAVLVLAVEAAVHGPAAAKVQQWCLYPWLDDDRQKYFPQGPLFYTGNRSGPQREVAAARVHISASFPLLLQKASQATQLGPKIVWCLPAAVILGGLFYYCEARLQ